MLSELNADNNGINGRAWRSPKDSPGGLVWQKFLNGWTADDEKKRDQAFLKLIAREYFRVIGTANRKYDPDHLIFGDRLSFYTYDEDVLKEMLPWVDAIAFQPHVWGPFPKAEFDAMYKLTVPQFPPK